jgi:hypothetical protein
MWRLGGARGGPALAHAAPSSAARGQRHYSRGQRHYNSDDMTSAMRPGTGEAAGGLARSTNADYDLFKYFNTNLN